MLKKIKYYIEICFISFSIIVLILSVINFFIPNILMNNLELFVSCFCISFLMMITDSFMQNAIKPIQILVGIADVSVVIFGLGGFVFKWFPITTFWILIVFLILVFVYFAVYLIMFSEQKAASKNINSKIKERKEKLKNGREDN